MKKVLLNFNSAKTAEWIHEYIKSKLEFEDFYGKNLDALYDELTSITEDTCLGVFWQRKKDKKLASYLKKIKKVFQDAERNNSHICVIFGNIEENYEDGRENSSL